MSPQIGKKATKVLLIDVDSRRPNLALMKLSEYHKRLGREVGFNVKDPDLVLASVIFRENIHLTDGYRFWFPNAEIVIGGSGTQEYGITLPDSAESLMPDYSLYDGLICQECGNLTRSCTCRSQAPTPGNAFYSMGFTTRGCVRHCHFCIVPDKEGKLHPAQHPSKFHPEGWKKCQLLDNNWYADRERFFETSEWFIQNRVAVDVTQGMDIRLIDEEIIDQLKRLKWWGTKHFAYDDKRYTKEVVYGIELLQSKGVDTKNNCDFYVYLDNDDEFLDALDRVLILQDLGATARLMFNRENERTERISKLQHYTWHTATYWASKWENFSWSKKERSVA